MRSWGRYGTFSRTPAISSTVLVLFGNASSKLVRAASRTSSSQVNQIFLAPGVENLGQDIGAVLPPWSCDLGRDGSSSFGIFAVQSSGLKGLSRGPYISRCGCRCSCEGDGGGDSTCRDSVCRVRKRLSSFPSVESWELWEVGAASDVATRIVGCDLGIDIYISKYRKELTTV